jgi:putative DNA primase/helicase
MDQKKESPGDGDAGTPEGATADQASASSISVTPDAVNLPACPIMHPNMMESALQLAEHVPIFPCTKEKTPRTPHGYKDATTETKGIKRWWQKHMFAMIGMPTGTASGIDVLDLDVKNGKNGFNAVPNWQDLSPIIVRTPSGGAHLWFKSDGTVRCSTSAIAPGVDTRGEGGYVILPPSFNIEGKYLFEKGGIGELGSLPPWPEEFAIAKRSRALPSLAAVQKEPTHYADTESLSAASELNEACAEMAATNEGSRNDTLNKLAFTLGQLIGAGRLEKSAATARLAEAAKKAGLGDAEIAATIKSGTDAGRKEPRLPTILVARGGISRTIDAAEAELIASGLPIFERGGMLVHPVKSMLTASHDRKTEAILLKCMRVENVIYMLNKRAAVFKQYDGRKKGLVVIDPPRDVAAGLLQKGQWRFPKVAGVITTPTMRPDGTILDQPGYDEMTQLWYSPDPHLVVPPVTANPTPADAEAALALIEGLLREFPFVSGLDRAVALAAILTPLLRGAFDVAPMFLFLAHVAGTGKSYLVNLAATLATGRPCPVITNCKSSEEMEKRLGALVLEGATVISLDNCSNDLGGDLLCQVTEQPLVRVRILGKSEAPECEWRGTMFGTGNNIRLVGDMTRRGVVCNLDANVERPELRHFGFDPIGIARADRGAYIAAALTVARAWRAAGEPGGASSIGSYGQWSKAVRAPLIWLGRQDPVVSMDAAREDDPVRDAARTLLSLCQEGASFTTAELVTMAHETGGGTLVYPELYDLLVEQCGTPRGEIDSRRVGRWLATVCGQVHDGCRLDLARDSRGHGKRYVLRKAGSNVS